MPQRRRRLFYSRWIKVSKGTAKGGAAARPPLLSDSWFWAAMLLGILVCLILSLVLLGEVRLRLQQHEWQRLLWLALIYPVAEEWLFRGQLQPRLAGTHRGGGTLLGFSGANLMTSLLFAALHLVSHTPLWAVAVIPPSLIFGAFRDRYGSILPAVLLHSVYNLAYYAVFGLPR
jgi:membrane protease YdiL (CAAX protease family)